MHLARSRFDGDGMAFLGANALGIGSRTRMECHLGNRRGRGVDRLEGDSLLFPGCYHDLARHAFDAQYRGSGVGG
jgi:hypothetical protein